MKYLDVFVAVNEGELLGVFDSYEEAEGRANAESDENYAYALEEYGLDPEEDIETAGFIAGYDGGCPYAEQITIDVNDPDRAYYTSEHDCFTGGHLLSMYEGDVDNDSYEVDAEDEDDGYDFQINEYGEGEIGL